jgi:hypothetical protein
MKKQRCKGTNLSGKNLDEIVENLCQRKQKKSGNLLSPKNDLAIKTDLTDKTLTNQNLWMEDKGDGGQGDTELERMHLRRRRIMVMDDQHNLRRSCMDGRQRQNQPPRSTRCVLTGCAGDAEASRHTKLM